MATRKKPSSSRKAAKTVEVSETPSVTAKQDPRPVSRRPLLLTLVAVVGVLGLLYLFRDRFIAATVNGQIISKAELVESLEKQYGSQALDNLITQAVVEQEAKKRNITISDEELDSEIAEIESRFTEQQQSLDDILTSQGYTREDLKDQVRLQLMVERMVSDKTSVTDEEVTQYLEENKDFLPTGVPEEQQRTDAQEDLKQEKINQEAQALLQELKANAAVRYFGNQPATPSLVTGQ